MQTVAPLNFAGKVFVNNAVSRAEYGKFHAANLAYIQDWLPLDTLPRVDVTQVETSTLKRLMRDLLRDRVLPFKRRIRTELSPDTELHYQVFHQAIRSPRLDILADSVIIRRPGKPNTTIDYDPKTDYSVEDFWGRVIEAAK